MTIINYNVITRAVGPEPKPKADKDEIKFPPFNRCVDINSWDEKFIPISWDHVHFSLPTDFEIYNEKICSLAADRYSVGIKIWFCFCFQYNQAKAYDTLTV